MDQRTEAVAFWGIYQLVTTQNQTIEAACREALANGWDLHIYRRSNELRTGINYRENEVLLSAHIGIGFTEARYGVPTIVEHQDHDVSWTDDEWSN